MYYLKHKYNFTTEQENDLYKEQNYKCAVCSCDIFPGTYHIDHDHNNGKVRGLLCGPCNTQLGSYERKKDMFEQFLKKAAKED